MMYDTRAVARGAARAEVLSAFMRGVYGWMSAGLALTAAVAFFAAATPGVRAVLWGNPMLLMILALGQIGLVVGLSAALPRLSAGAATGMFLLYAGLNGLTLSTIFAVYSVAGIFKAFIATAGMFGAMSLYGLTTRRDLTGWGSFLFMGLVGILLASLVNFFFNSPMVDFVISAAGVIIFTGLTAYDTQVLMAMGHSAPYGDAAALRRGSIMGALKLYLDFINLFLMLLRLLNDRR